MGLTDKRIIKIFSNKNSYINTNRYYLNDITKALWNDRTQTERDQVYGAWVQHYEYTPEIGQADAAFLTYKWNYYVERDLVLQALEEIEDASRHGKKTVVFSGGDSPASLTHPDVLLFESGGYRSTAGLAYHSGQPFFMRDYISLYCEGQLRVRPKPPMPVLAFCGQASASPLRTAFRKVRNRWLNWQFRQGRLKWQPPPFETTSFRYRVLRQFAHRPELVRTNFLLREQYHAGNDRERSDFSPQKLAFVDNILGSDYTVCMRGGGNFSIRFYETLCLGRIPVFIDTDCLLPFQDRIPYRDIFPWIEMKDLPQAAEIVADFHARLSENDFIALQHTCRRLWEEHFTPNGFFGDLRKVIKEIL